MKATLNLVYSLAFIGSTMAALAIEKPDKGRVFFQENKGQICDQNCKPRPDVKFSGNSGGMNYHISTSGISYQFCSVLKWQETLDKKTKTLVKSPLQSIINRVDIKWVNSNSFSTIETSGLIDGVSNYYLPHCMNGIVNVKSYEQIISKDVYDNIDLKWYSNNGELEYDFIVRPLGNVEDIVMKISGADNIKINSNGELEFSVGNNVIKQKAPVAFQNNRKIKANWNIKNNQVGFSIKNYDKNEVLIIDPVVRLWGTYYGGSGTDQLRKIRIDAVGNTYSSGNSSTATSTIIATTGAFQTTFNGGLSDAILLKMNSSGVRQWATYFGGSADDYALTCAVDAASPQGVYIAGYTNSSGLATVGSHQTTSSGSDDGFIVRFNAATGARLWSTYYGNTSDDFVYDCAVDGANNLIAVGSTSFAPSSTLIATPGAHQTAFAGGSQRDGFIVKFNSGGVRQWGTYYGGPSMTDDLFGCSVDKTTNDIYVCGQTMGLTGIVTTGAHQTSIGAGFDGLLAKFSSAGVRIWGTYYGGSGSDALMSVSLNSLGDIYTAGYTTGSISGISTPGSHQAAFFGGSSDAIVVKFNTGGVRQWGTYYGGAAIDRINDCSADNSGNVFFVGQTTSMSQISTTGSHQGSFSGGTAVDAFIAGLSSAGGRIWGSYYGEGVTSVDEGFSCTIDNLSDNIYMVGQTQAPTASVIATLGSHQSAFGGATDGYIVKFVSCLSSTVSIGVSSTSLCPGFPLTLSASGTSGITTFTWSTGATTTSIVVNPTINTTYTVTAGTSTPGCIYSDVQTVTLMPAPSVSVSSPNTNICSGSSTILQASGASSYNWQPGGFINANVSVSPSVTTTYSVTGANALGCTNTKTITVNVNPTPTLSTTHYTICTGGTATLTASGAPTYSWSTGATTSSITVSPSSNTTYTVRGINGSCIDVNTVSVTVGSSVSIAVTPIAPSVCIGNSVTVTASGATSYTWSTGSNSTSIVVSPTVNTTYTINGMNGTCSGSRTITVLANANPTVNTTSSSSLICTGSSATLSATGASIYNWNPGSLSGTSVVVSPTTTTTYSVVGTNTAGCSNTRTISVTVSACTSVSELQDNGAQLIIYPNPALGYLNVIVSEDTELHIMDPLGKTISTERLNNGINSLNISFLSSGMYILQIKNGTRVKLIKE